MKKLLIQLPFLYLSMFIGCHIGTVAQSVPDKNKTLFNSLFVKKIIENKVIQNLLKLSDSKRHIIKITDKYQCFYDYSGMIDSVNYLVINRDFTYKFNSGNAREIVVGGFQKKSQSEYTLILLLYPYGCKDDGTNIYSLNLILEKSENIFNVISYTLGDVD